jgi:hypothetical protein
MGESRGTLLVFREERKSVTLFGSHSSTACSSDRSSLKIKTSELREIVT